MPKNKTIQRHEQAKAIAAQTWSFQVLDEECDHEKPHNSPPQRNHATSEDEPRRDRVTSSKQEAACGKERLSTIADECVLSAHTGITNTASLDRTNNQVMSETPTAHEHLHTEQTTKVDAAMTPVKPQRRPRIKYKEAPAVLSSTTTATTPSAAQPRSLHPAPPPTEASPPPSLTHSETPDNLPLMTESVTTPTELTPEATYTVGALASYSTSSSESYRNSRPRLDSAIDMKGTSRGRGHRGRQTESDDQELVFRGRSSIGPSNNDTNDSWRWDPTLGTLVSNTSATSYRPPLASKSSNQQTAKERSNPSATRSAATTNLKLQDSNWAKEPAAETGSGSTWDAAGHDTWNAGATADGGWDTGHPPLPTKSRIAPTSEQNSHGHTEPPRRPFNHNGRVRIERKSKKPKESPWIKDSDIPKGDPKRHKMRWSSPSRESSSFNSSRPSSGWGTRRKRDPNNNGADLADWAGGLGPASIDWDSRARFRDHQSEAKIEAWLERTSTELEFVKEIQLTNGKNKFSFVVAPSGIRTLVDKEQGDVAPRYWMPTTMDGMTLDAFWMQHIHIKDNDVTPFDTDDLRNAKPWWRTYVDGIHDMLLVSSPPEVAGVDPNENEAEKLAREHDNGGAHAGENRKAAEKAKREAHRKRTLARQAKAHKISATYAANNDAVATNTIKPGLNLFIRSVTKDDMIQVRDIYNRYIDNAFVVPETTRLDENDMLQRWQDIKSAGLPFIVACQRGDKIKARNKKVNGGEDRIMPDRVVGFAYADDWSDGTCIFRPTVKLGLFVSMEHYMKHIGDCLADKMMCLLDPSFIGRGGYDVVDGELDTDGPKRAISNVLVRYSYEAERTEKFLWVSKWLKKHFGFEKVADLKGVAQKFDKQ